MESESWLEQVESWLDAALLLQLALFLLVAFDHRRRPSDQPGLKLHEGAQSERASEQQSGHPAFCLLQVCACTVLAVHYALLAVAGRQGLPGPLGQPSLGRVCYTASAVMWLACLCLLLVLGARRKGVGYSLRLWWALNAYMAAARLPLGAEGSSLASSAGDLARTVVSVAALAASLFLGATAVLEPCIRNPPLPALAPQSLMFVGPVSMVSLAGYTSHILVIFQFYLNGDGEWLGGTAAIALHTISAMAVILFATPSGHHRSCNIAHLRAIGPTCALVPFNLHLAHVGIRCSAIPQGSHLRQPMQFLFLAMKGLETSLITFVLAVTRCYSLC